MKILIHSMAIVVGAGLGIALGIALRGKSVPENPDAAAIASSSEESRAGKPGDLGQAAVPFPDDSPLATKLERDLSMSIGVTRWLYWLEAIEKATPADFPRLRRLAQGNPAATRLIIDRWIELYPRHAFDTVVAAFKEGRFNSVQDLANRLFQDWPKRDPDAAIAALSEAPTVGALRGWRGTVAAAIVEVDPERGLPLFRQWNIENHGPRTGGIAKWAAANPRHAAEFALANQSGYVTELSMEAIGKEWAKTDPAGALAFASTRPEGFSSTLAKTVLKEWAGRNFNDAAEWLGKTDAQTRNRLSPSFVEAWAKRDASGALTWCESNLAGSGLAEAVGGVVRGVAEKDVAAAGALVASLNPSPARTEAAAALARKYFPDMMSSKPVTPEAVAWLSSLDRDSVRRVLEDISWQWAGSDSKSMAAFLVAKPSDQVPESAYSALARELAHKNPSEAMEWASRLPEDRALRVGGDAFAEWRRTQPESAMNWFNELPPTDPRRIPFFQSAIRTLAWDPQAELAFASMTPSERSIAQNVIQGMTTLPVDRRAKLLESLKTN